MPTEKQLGVAMLSRWHVHANEYARAIQSQANANVVAVWDEIPSRGREWANELAVPFEESYDRLLARSDVDAVCVVTPTNIHREIMLLAANAGKHIFTEKVLATTCDEAVEIASAVASNDVKFCISFPRRTLPEIKFAKEALNAGLFGQLTMIRIRIAHAGASRNWLPEHFYDLDACGGGAMMDLGAHGMYLSRWLGGRPLTVASIFTHTTGRAVEDNAISLIEFENGAIAVNETSFVAYPDSYSLELDGTEGAYRMLSPREGVQIRSDSLDQRGWQTPEKLPERGESPISQWVSACTNGTDIEFDIGAAVELTELMEAAYDSYRTGQAASVEKNKT